MRHVLFPPLSFSPSIGQLGHKESVLLSIVLSLIDADSIPPAAVYPTRVRVRVRAEIIREKKGRDYFVRKLQEISIPQNFHFRRYVGEISRGG